MSNEIIDNPTNTPRVFHVEMTWKRTFPCRFNVESTWSVIRESIFFVNFTLTFSPLDVHILLTNFGLVLAIFDVVLITTAGW